MWCIFTVYIEKRNINLLVHFSFLQGDKGEKGLIGEKVL